MSNLKSYYFAYGSNLSKEQMAIRCPGSDYLISGRLSGYAWLINSWGYASVKPSPNAFVLGEIFTLSEQDIEYLDIYESVAEGMYDKNILSIQTEEGLFDCLVYIAFNNDIAIVPYGQDRTTNTLMLRFENTQREIKRNFGNLG